MKKIILFFLLCISSLSVFSQLATFDWRIHVSFTNPSSIASDGETVLCAFKNGILTYDIEANETEVWSYTNYLSDVEISSVYYDKISTAFWIGYNNGNIDMIQGNTIINIPYLKLANILGSKKINSFLSHDDKVYAISDFGILVIDPKKHEIKETYYTNQNGNNNLQLTFTKDSIYSLTPQGVYVAKANNPILADYGQWHLIPQTELSNSMSTYNSMVSWNGYLVLGKKNPDFGADSVYFFKEGILSQPIPNNYELSDLLLIDDELCIAHIYGAQFFDKNFKETNRFYQYEFSNQTNVKTLVKAGDDFYFADNTYGLVKFKNDWNNSKLSPQGPANNVFYRAKGKKDKMIFGGGSIDRLGSSFSKAQAYTLEDEQWDFYVQKTLGETMQSFKIWDFNAIDIDPKNPKRIAIGGAGEDFCLFILEGDQLIEKYGMSNSLIENLLDDNGLATISDVAYDKKGNLWILNAFCDHPLKLLTKDGVFYQFETGSSTRRIFVDRLTIDKDGNPWFIAEGKGIVGYFTNGTLDDVTDDSFKILNSGDFTGALPSNDVTDILSTQDGKIWITTSEGFSILNNPSAVANAENGNYNSFRPKVQFGENTEYFFGETYITCGIVDGGNRKWVGTKDAGLFCLKEDGYGIIYEFNTKNSKLISNTIIDLAFNEKTGELFVVTDLGLESIRVDASEGASDYKETIVFPNPVLPEYTGVITIQGIKTDSDIKITDVAGNLVYKTTSNGGTAIWDGKKLNGEEIASGVYIIWTAPKKGKGSKVGKVTVIR